MSKINPEFYAPYDYTPNIARSRHNLGTKRSYNLQTGALTPVYWRRLYKGDDFKLNPHTLLQTIFPMDYPLLDCFELRLEFYMCPLTNYYGWMDNNTKSNVEDIVKNSPKWSVDIYNSQSTGLLRTPMDDDYATIDDWLSSGEFIQKGSLFQKFGVPAGFTGSYEMGQIEDSQFNTVQIEPFLCYLDIVRAFHVNTQYESIPFFGGADFVSNRNPFVNIWTHQSLDDLFLELRHQSRNVTNDLNITSLSNSLGWASYLQQWLKLCTEEQGGYFPVQHRPDLWRNLLSSRTGTVQATVTPNDDGTISVVEMRDQNHFQTLYERLYLSGGRYSNILRTGWGKKAYNALKIPQLLGTVRQLIDPSNITATASTVVGDETTKLGRKASNIDTFNTGKPIRVRPDVDSYLMVVASITPLPAYSQGFDPEICALSFNDEFNPALQGLSWESVPQGYYSGLPVLFEPADAGTPTLLNFPDLRTEVGKQVKWLPLRTDVNRCYDEFTPFMGEYEQMVLSRRYMRKESITGFDDSDIEFRFNLSPYVNPYDYNHIFSLNRITQQPFALHIGFGINAKRPILKRITSSM